MKKIIFTLIIILVSIISVNAGNRKIVIDKQTENSRLVEAQCGRIGGMTATKILNYGIQTWINDTDTSFVMVTNVNTLNPLGAFDDAIMLIKTIDDEVIELYCVTSDNNSTKIKYGNPTITTTIWKNRITSTYNSNSTNISRNINYWHITPEIINILKSGIKKIKIQYENGAYEKEFKKDEIGKILYDIYVTELDYINSYKNKKDKFKEDF